LRLAWAWSNDDDGTAHQLTKRQPRRVLSGVVKLRTFLRGLPPWAKVLIPASIGLGLACVGIGHIGDTHKFWDEQSFAANLFSTFTGALFGIPFGVVYDVSDDENVERC
jgi:hypothetical protein